MSIIALINARATIAAGIFGLMIPACVFCLLLALCYGAGCRDTWQSLSLRDEAALCVGLIAVFLVGELIV